VILVLLQNPWSPHYAGRVWPRRFWLKALWRSRTGKRLRQMLDGISEEHYIIDEANPICTATPSGVMPFDKLHVEVLIKANPQIRVIVACGKQAQKACDYLVSRGLYGSSVLHVPHPAYRLLTSVGVHQIRCSTRWLAWGDAHWPYWRVNPIGQLVRIEKPEA
jgi:hypothetical protein